LNDNLSCNVEIEKILMNNEKEKSKISEVHVEFDSEILKNGIKFVDTPGLNESGELDHFVEKLKEINGKYLFFFFIYFVIFFYKGIIFLINAKQQLSKTCDSFLKQIQLSSSISSDQIFFLVTHWVYFCYFYIFQ
jgi:predicted GTPase